MRSNKPSSLQKGDGTPDDTFTELKDEELEGVSGGWMQGTCSQLLLVMEVLNFVESNKTQWGCRTKGFYDLLKNASHYSEIRDYLWSNKGCDDPFIDRVYREFFDKD